MEAIFVQQRVRISSVLLFFSFLSLSIALGFAVLPPSSATAAPRAICTWTGATDNTWGTDANWGCGHVPTTGDTVLINGSTTAAPTITGVSAATITAFQVINNASATLTANVTSTLTINGGGTGFQIDAGSSLTLGGGPAVTIALANGTNGTVSGSMTVTGAAHRLTAFNPSPVTFQNGATFTAGTGFSGNAFGTANLTSTVFANGSTYIHKAGSNPFGATQPASVVVFQSGSTFSYQSISGSPAFSGRTYANFELNSSGNISGNGSNPLSIDSLTVTTGTLNVGMTGQFNLKGNISVASGATLNFSPASAPTSPLTFSGSAAQTVSGSGTLTFTVNQAVAISNTNGVSLQRDVTIAGALALTAGDLSTGAYTLTLASTSVTGSGDVVGNVKRVGPFTPGLNYPFNNANTLINFGSITSAPGDITITLAKSGPGGLANAIPRQYTITPTSNGTFDASLRLGYKQDEVGALVESALRPWKNEGTWTVQPGSPDASNNYVTALGVTSFSDWAIAESATELPTDPSGSGAANPSALVAGLPTLLTVTVTPGTNPPSTQLGVTCDLTPIGGAVGQSLYDNGTNGDVTAGDNTFSYSAIVSDGISAGAKSLSCSIADHEGRSGSTAIALTIIAVLPIGSVNGPVGDSDDATTHRSSYAPPSGNGAGSTVVNVRGVIYEKTLQPIKNSTNVYYGFFIQNTITTTDGISNTSDGLYVFMNTTPTISGPGGTTYTPIVGDEVVLSGSVSEYYNMTELQSPGLALLQLVRSGVNLDTEVAPFVANPPIGVDDANRYWERRQGMRAQVPQNSIVLNGRSVFNPPDGEIWLARSDNTIAGRTDPYARRAFRDAHPLDDNYSASTWDGNGYRILMGSWGIKATAGDGQALITPARTFSTLTNAPVGGVNYSFSKYRIEVTAQPTFTEGVDPAANNPPQIFDRSHGYSIVDYNLENLYDYRDNPFSGCDFAGNSGCSKYGPFRDDVIPPYDYVPASDAAYQARLTDIANQIITDLHEPDILMVQEIENQDICTVTSSALNCGDTDNADGKPDVLQELALKIASLGGPAYDAAFDRDSSDLRGIAPAFMYRIDRVQLLPATGDPVLGANPSISYAGAGAPANANISNPKTLNATVVLPGGAKICETNWVFPRAPDIGLFRIYQTSIGVGGYRDVYVINNHFKSTPDDCMEHRTEQAKYNAAIVQFIQNANPNARIVVGGDLNVYPRPDDPIAPIGQPTSSDQLGSLYAPGLGLNNLWELLLAEHPESAYSYVYVGMAQTLDQMFVNQALLTDLQQFRTAHINSDFAADNPGDGARGTSDHDPNVAIFTLPNAMPTLTSISPTSAQAGGPAFTLTLTGTNFVNSTTARWNGADLTTGFVSSTQLTATVLASNILNFGTANVTVFNPTPGGGTSSPQTFTIGQTNTGLHLTVSASSVPAGRPITFTATLTQVYGASARVRGPRDVTPSGIVTFTLDSTTNVTRTMGAAGVATYVTDTLVVGPHTMTATYSGDANLVSATSETVPFLISSRKLFLPFAARGPASAPSSR